MYDELKLSGTECFVCVIYSVCVSLYSLCPVSDPALCSSVPGLTDILSQQEIATGDQGPTLHYGTLSNQAYIHFRRWNIMQLFWRFLVLISRLKEGS